MIINGKDFNHLFRVARQRIREAIEGGVPVAQSMIEEKDNLLIVSDGSAANTKIYCNGVIVKNVASIEIDIEIDKPLPGGVVRAKIEVLSPRLHIRANLK